jgi:hypothetical protein
MSPTPVEVTGQDDAVHEDLVDVALDLLDRVQDPVQQKDLGRDGDEHHQCNYPEHGVAHGSSFFSTDCFNPETGPGVAGRRPRAIC